MGILQELGALGGQLGGNQNQSNVASGLMGAFEQHPGGIGGIINSLRQNGLSSHVDAWSSGQPAEATPAQIQQGFSGTNVIENTAQHTGLSHEAVAVAIGVLLPMIISHFAPGGQPAPQSQFGGLAQQFLGKFL